MNLALDWKLDYLITGALLFNVPGRIMHTHAVKTLLYNFRVHVLQYTQNKIHPPLPELPFLSFRRRDRASENICNYKLPKHYIVDNDINLFGNEHTKWLKLLIDP